MFLRVHGARRKPPKGSGCQGELLRSTPASRLSICLVCVAAGRAKASGVDTNYCQKYEYYCCCFSPRWTRERQDADRGEARGVWFQKPPRSKIIFFVKFYIFSQFLFFYLLILFPIYSALQLEDRGDTLLPTTISYHSDIPSYRPV